MEEENVIVTPTPEATQIDYTWLLEQMYLEEQEQTELLQEVRSELEQANVNLNAINSGVEKVGENVWFILCLVLLSFCCSCMRGWRKAVMGYGR